MSHGEVVERAVVPLAFILCQSSGAGERLLLRDRCPVAEGSDMGWYHQLSHLINVVTPVREHVSNIDLSQVSVRMRGGTIDFCVLSIV
jgi:hypothetical protein